MHMLIRAIVYANSKIEAKDKATAIFERLVEKGDFDYYSLATSNRSRWYVDIELASSKNGKMLIRNGMSATKSDMVQALDEIRKIVTTQNNETIWRSQRDRNMFQHQCHIVGQYSGNYVYVYDDDGAGIKTPGHLRSVLTKWQHQTNQYQHKDIYVVCADVHW
jgi:hypothetical protein